MGLLNFIKDKMSTDTAPDEPHAPGDGMDGVEDGNKLDPIFYDTEGKLLTSDDIKAYIETELDRRERDRRPYELQWVINTNFLCGHQNCDIRVSDNTIQDTMPVHDYDSHEVFNRIKPLYDTRIANLMSVNYLMSVIPATNELDDYDKADISTKLLRYLQETLEFDRMKNTILHWVERMGNAYVLSWWDTTKGEPVDGDGLREGDISCGLISPYELYADNVYKPNMADQNSIITKQVMKVEEIYNVYGISVDGHDCDVYISSPHNGASVYGANYATFAQTKSTVENSEYVITYYERASRRYPKGRLAIMIGDELIHYGELPYDYIPITAFKCKEDAGSFYGKSTIEELIPLQRAYNGCKNRILDFYRRIAFPVLTTAKGSLVDIDYIRDNGLEPGSILDYSGNKPDYLDPPNLPPGILDECRQLAQDMEYTAGVSQLMVYGQAASGASGTAIQTRREIDSTRMSLTSENIRTAVLDMAKIWLKIYKRYANGYRVCRISGLNDTGGIITWTKDDITSFDVVFDTENELKYSEENQKQAFMEAYQLGLFADDAGRIPRSVKRRAAEILKVGGKRDIITIDELQTQSAGRENSYFTCGVIPELHEYDDDEIHLEEHKKYQLQMKFELLRRKSPEYAAKLDEHIAMHTQRMQMAAAQEAMQAQQLQGAQMPEQQMPAQGNAI